MVRVLLPVRLLQEAAACAMLGAALGAVRAFLPARGRAAFVPDVLLSGNHAKVDRFRRDEALEKTNELRPDLIEALDCAKLDKADRKTLMALGWEVSAAHPRKR